MTDPQIYDYSGLTLNESLKIEVFILFQEETRRTKTLIRKF